MKTMRKLIYILLLTALLLTTGCSRILQINIVLPMPLYPYYDWLLSFPGCRILPDEPSPIKVWTEYIAEATDAMRLRGAVFLSTNLFVS